MVTKLNVYVSSDKQYVWEINEETMKPPSLVYNIFVLFNEWIVTLQTKYFYRYKE